MCELEFVLLASMGNTLKILFRDIQENLTVLYTTVFLSSSQYFACNQS